MEENTIVPLDIHLVRYNDPVLVEELEEKLPSKELDGNDGQTSDEKLKACDNILNCIFPPREWEENGKLWRQEVSKQPATGWDVIKLTKLLDMTLNHLKAQETGICPIRRALYSQCFDEIIRQVTVDCAERGLLLQKVRDELKMSTDAYKTFYDSSIHFALRKPFSAKDKQSDLLNRLIELEAKNRKIKDDLATTIAKNEMIQTQAARERLEVQKKHDDQINFLKKANEQMEYMLELHRKPL